MVTSLSFFIITLTIFCCAAVALRVKAGMNDDVINCSSLEVSHQQWHFYQLSPSKFSLLLPLLCRKSRILYIVQVIFLPSILPYQFLDNYLCPSYASWVPHTVPALSVWLYLFLTQLKLMLWMEIQDEDR
jgi:hypothetical protein